MDQHFSLSRRVLITGYLYIVIFDVGVQPTKAKICAIQLEDRMIPCVEDVRDVLQISVVQDEKECCVEKGGRAIYSNWRAGKRECTACEEVRAMLTDTEDTRVPFCVTQQEQKAIACYGNPHSLRNTTARDANECCVQNRGHVLYVPLPEWKWECIVCQEVQVEHKWLPSPPCDKYDCNHFPQAYLWFSLSIPQRQIECMGRSYKDKLHCRRNTTLCSSPEPTTRPVFCFKHRFQTFNSSSWGCPASSMDWELARDVRDCCFTRGRAGYANHIKGWYIGVARLHGCEPCPHNPSSDTTWSQWSACSSGSTCSRKRSMQIPYLENMPQHWCVETITMEESAVDTECGSTIILALAVVGLSTSFVLIGVLCFICIRKCLKSRSQTSPEPTTNQQTVEYKTGDSQAHLAAMNPYSSTPPAHRPKPRALPEISEQIYEQITYSSMDEAAVVMPLPPSPSAVYMEMK